MVRCGFIIQPLTYNKTWDFSFICAWVVDCTVLIMCFLLRFVKMLVKVTTTLGEWVVHTLVQLGQAGLLLFYSLCTVPDLKKGLPLLVQQIYKVGVLSLLIIVVSGVFIGMVLALQGYTILSVYGSEQAVGQLVALSLLREIGPVVSALLFAGRAGSALTAEIGLMKATEQLSSYEMIGVDPYRHIMAPRLWAGFICMPLLMFVFNFAGIWGAALVTVDWLGIFEGSFWANMRQAVDFYQDVLNGTIKALVFGFVISWIAVFQGDQAYPNAEGISRATTKTVVYASLAVLALDTS